MTCCGIGACGADQAPADGTAAIGAAGASGAAGAIGVAGTAGVDTGGAGAAGAATGGAGAGGAIGLAGAAGAAGAAAGAGGAAAGAGGAAGAAGTAGAAGAAGAPPTPFCDSQTPKALPYQIISGGSYVPSGWFPATGPMDMTAVACPVGPITFPDAGASPADAGAPPTFTTCQGVTYLQADPLNLFAGINWVPNTAPVTPASCFEGVTAVEFWVAGTPGAIVEFTAHGTVLPVTLSTTWTQYSIPIAGNLNTNGVAVAFTVGFNPSPTITGPGPVTVYYADPTYVGN